MKRAVLSVLNQTYTDFECIVVDDASNDGTQKVVNSFKDDRLVYLRNNNNRGASASRNRGFRKSKGNFIAFLDDDDEWLDEKLEKQVTLLESLSEDYGLVYCWMDYYDDQGNIIYNHHPTLRGYVFPKVLDVQRLGGCPTLLVRREVFDEVQGFDESLPRGNDGDFIRRVSKKYYVELVSEVLVKVFTAHGKVRISDYDLKGLHNAIVGEKIKLIKFSEELIVLPKIKAAILLKIANHYFELGEKSKAIQIERKAIKLDKTILLKRLYYSFPNIVQRYILNIYRIGKKLKIF